MNLKYYLDKEAFDKTPDGAVIATGETIDNPDGLHLANTDKPLRWVAKKGSADDWCVYAHLIEHSAEWILAHGDKVCTKRNIDNILKITDEIWSKYRF